MPRERVTLEPAWLLARRPYRETSSLLEVLTPAYGRVGLVARGVRGQRSRRGGALQMFQPLLLSWSASGDLGALTGSEAGGRGWALGGEAVFAGWYLNELLLRLLARHDAQPMLYTVYTETLPQLAGAHAEPALRRFEVALLEALGYGLPLSDEFDADARYTWDPEQGAQRSDDGSGFSGAAFIALREGRYMESGTRGEVRALLRTAIDRQLGGRELESRRLLRAVRRV